MALCLLCRPKQLVGGVAFQSPTASGGDSQKKALYFLSDIALSFRAKREIFPHAKDFSVAHAPSE